MNCMNNWRFVFQRLSRGVCFRAALAVFLRAEAWQAVEQDADQGIVSETFYSRTSTAFLQSGGVADDGGGVPSGPAVVCSGGVEARDGRRGGRRSASQRALLGRAHGQRSLLERAVHTQDLPSFFVCRY